MNDGTLPPVDGDEALNDGAEVGEEDSPNLKPTLDEVEELKAEVVGAENPLKAAGEAKIHELEHEWDVAVHDG